MKDRVKICRLLLAIFTGLLSGCAGHTANPDIPEQVQEVMTSRTPEDFMAQSKQFKGTGGWQDYSSLRIFEGGATSLFETANGELKVSVTSAFNKKFVLFLIPGAVYMSQGIPDRFAANTDTLEYIGIRSQTHLFFLEKAFPEGPKGVRDTVTRTIEGTSKEVIRFLQAYTIITPPWKADVTVSRTSPHHVDFVISLTTGPEDAPERVDSVKGVWSDEPIDTLLADSSELDSWFVNYQRIGTRDVEGHVVTDVPILGTSSFQTVGDIRQAVKARAGKSPE